MQPASCRVDSPHRPVPSPERALRRRATVPDRLDPTVGREYSFRRLLLAWLAEASNYRWTRVPLEAVLRERLPQARICLRFARAGKTTLAVPLAAELGYALLSKDRIKEILHDAFGAPEPARAWSRRLGAAAMELWALAADAPAAVIEANFRPHHAYQRAKLSGLAARPVEVHCACPPELAVKRYNARATHPAHVVTTLQLEAMAEYDRPVGSAPS